MRATGIVRKIDDLGRIVIPKEIRKTLRIRESDPLEIFTDRDGQIILKKYSPIGELDSFARDYVESLSATSGHIVCVTDRDTVISIAGGLKKEYFDKPTSDVFDKQLDQRNMYTASKGDALFVPVINNDDIVAFNYQLVAPIISEGDVIGAVVMISADRPMNELDDKLASCAANFLGRLLEG